MVSGTNDGQGTKDAATVLPFIAAILFLPPLILIFASPVTVSGLPLVLLYVFAAWALVIACAFVLALRLRDFRDAPGEIDRKESDEGSSVQPHATGRRMPP